VENDFDRIIPRDATFTLKYDARPAIFGRADVIPLWVADMDFAVPEAVQHALVERAAHPIYGYTIYPESTYSAVTNWLKNRHGWEVPREWVVMCPGIMPSLHAAILALTKEREAVVVQPPIYPPFLTAPVVTQRNLVCNPLKFESGRYHFDLDHFEKCAIEGARLLLLCSPHNPVGRVWQQQELQSLLEICRRYGVTVVADEVHADLIYPRQQHTPLAMLAEGKVNVLTAIAPSKTFNIPGLGLSAMIVPNAANRAAINQEFGRLLVTASNPFSIAAFEAAYREGAPWLNDLLDYLADTRDFVRDFIQQHLPCIKLIEPEGTYLLWLDCSAMQLSDKQLKRFFVQEAGVGLSPGTLFGAEEGKGFMRMNIAAPRSVVSRALDNIASAEAKRVQR
jgi:cystathionine beta-lyase